MLKIKKPDIKLSLPAEKSVPSERLGDYTWLIYGERKIGKTSLAAQFDDPYFLMFEPGAKHLSVKQSFCKDWKTFLKYLELLEGKPKYCQTIVLDTGYMLYERCFEFCLKELKLEDPRDKSWGGGWKFIDREFRKAHDRITELGGGLIVLAHSEEKQIKTRMGVEYTKLCMQLGGQATRYYGGVLDIISYYHYDENKKRFMTIKGSADVDAGVRATGHFLGIEEIPMGNSPEEAYRNLNLAFLNNLKPKEEKHKIKLRKP